MDAGIDDKQKLRKMIHRTVQAVQRSKELLRRTNELQQQSRAVMTAKKIRIS